MEALLFGDADPIARHRSRVLSDSGQILNLTFARAVAQWLRQSGEQDRTLLLALPGAGVKTRDSGLDRFVTKLYSIQLPANDLTQTTEVNQPYLTGLIAPGDVISLHNPNAGVRFVSIPNINFTGLQPFSITVVLNNNWTELTGSSSRMGILTDTVDSRGVYLNAAAGKVTVRDSASTAYTFTLSNTYLLVGKIAIYSIVFTGSALILYEIGTLVESVGCASFPFYSTRLFGARVINARIPYFRIGGSMPASQAASEAAMLRTYIPEIPAVQIVSQTWSIRNLDMVCTPVGNIIQEIQLNSATERIVNGEFSSGLASWNNPEGGVSVVSGKAVFPGTNLTERLVSNPNLIVGRWYKVSFTVSDYSAGTVFCQLGGNGPNTGNKNANGTYTHILKTTATAVTTNFYVSGNNNFIGKIDDIKCEELGWMDSTEIYDAVYAATSGDATTKHYAALKEAAMWCSYSNTETNQVVFGKLYNWYAAALLDADMISSSYGWRVPSQGDFNTLIDSLGGTNIAGGKLKITGTTFWNSPNASADNSSGFCALASGFRSQVSGGYSNLLANFLICARDEASAPNAMQYYLGATNGQFQFTSSSKARGYSLRLYKT